MKSAYEIPKPSKRIKKKEMGQRFGRGLCETSKSFDSVDLHLNGNKTGLLSGTVGAGL